MYHMLTSNLFPLAPNAGNLVVHYRKDADVVVQDRPVLGVW